MQLILEGCRVEMERMVPFGGWISMAGYFGRRPCSEFRISLLESLKLAHYHQSEVKANTEK